MSRERVQANKQGFQYCALGVLLLLCWMLQSAPGGFLTLWQVRPMPVPVLTAAIGMVYGERVGGAFGLAAGLLMDVYTVPTVGFHVILLTAVGIACGLIIRHLFMRNFAAAFTLCMATGFVYFLSYWLVFKVLLGGGGVWAYLVRFSLPAAVYSGLFGLLFYPLIRWFRRVWRRGGPSW